MTRLGLLAACCGALLALLVSRFAHAQDLHSWLFNPEENAQRTLSEGKQGILFIETILSEQGQPRDCNGMEIGLARLSDGWKGQMPTRSIHPLLQPFNSILGGVAGISPGDYVINSIKCERRVFNGLQAKFRIRAGEVVNLGAIRFDIRARDGFFVQTTVAHRSIGSLTPDVVAYFKQTYPKTFSRAVNRPMSLVGPPDAEYKGLLWAFQPHSSPC